ncbi:MAG: L,D-transpeptidase family protein [Pseudomonadota bacterium]|nr:L,D-transpeptidase family protein [Pseudomonadota bacterium]
MQLIVYEGGLLVRENRTFRCAIGRSGITNDKREGDGATPIGEFYLREIYFRPDRLKSPQSNLPITAIGPDDGWSDDPADPDYNRRVAIPHAFRHETLWRSDSLYDIVVPLGYNDEPTVSGLGSAIFLHIASDQYTATEGCVALARNDLLEILKDCDHTSVVIVKPSASAVQR